MRVFRETGGGKRNPRPAARPLDSYANQMLTSIVMY